MGLAVLMARSWCSPDVDFGALKVLVLAFWCAALVFWHLIVRDRCRSSDGVGADDPARRVLAVRRVENTSSATSPTLGCAFGVLWWTDRCRRRQAWTTGPLTSLVVLGLLARSLLQHPARRPGARRCRRCTEPVQLLGDKRSRTLEPARWDRMLLVLGTFLTAMRGVPDHPASVVSPSYPGTGLANIPDRLAWYRDIVAQQLGLMTAADGPSDAARVHTAGTGRVMTVVLVGSHRPGVASGAEPPTDLPLAVFAGAHAFVVGIAPFQEGRYLFPIVPVILYFSAVALPSVVTLARRTGSSPAHRTPRWPVVGATALVAVLVVASFRRRGTGGRGRRHCARTARCSGDLRTRTPSNCSVPSVPSPAPTTWWRSSVPVP